MMARANTISTSKAGDESASKQAMTAEELQVVRNQVGNVIAKGAVAMTKHIVKSLEEGETAPNATIVKFLFELAGLYPAEPAESDEQESLAKVLMQRLGFSEDTMPKADEDAEE